MQTAKLTATRTCLCLPLPSISSNGPRSQEKRRKLMKGDDFLWTQCNDINYKVDIYMHSVQNEGMSLQSMSGLSPVKTNDAVTFSDRLISNNF